MLNIHNNNGEWITDPIKSEALKGEVSFFLEDFTPENDTADFTQAIENFIAMTPHAFKRAEPYLFNHYEDMIRLWEPEEDEFERFNDAANVWRHVAFSDEIIVSRREHDHCVYISIEGNCDWEEEHGLQLVFKNGNELAKVSSYSGHLTNADAYDDPSLEGVIYKKRF